MQLYWTYLGCDPSQQTAIAEACRSRQAELEAKVDLIGGDQRSPLVVTVERADAASPSWSMQASYYAPRGHSTVEARADDMFDTLDRLIGALSQRIDEQADQPLSVSERRRGLRGFLPFLQSFRREGMSREFIALLRALAGSLHRYIAREMGTRRSLGELPAGQTSPQEVIDSALLKAWHRFDQRDDQQPLDAWFVQLMEESLDELAQPTAERSLDARQPTPTTEPRETQTFETVEHVTEPETTALARTIAEQPDVDPWNRLDVETKQTRLHAMLRGLSREQRQALMLQTLEGFNETEIADLQSRSVDAVLRDLDEAKQSVREMFTEHDYPDIQEQLEREALARPRRSHRT